MEVFDVKSDPKGEPCPLGPSDLCTSINWRVFVAIVIHFSPSKVLLSAVYKCQMLVRFLYSFAASERLNKSPHRFIRLFLRSPLTVTALGKLPATLRA